MAMPPRKKEVVYLSSRADLLPCILASLGLRTKPDFDDWQNEKMTRIHWTIRILKHAGFSPVACYGYERYHDGPFSDALENDLETLDWNKTMTTAMIDDAKIVMVREAVERGDDFLLALSIAVGVADHNQGISKQEVSEMIAHLIPEIGEVADPACDFAEARIWSK